MSSTLPFDPRLDPSRPARSRRLVHRRPPILTPSLLLAGLLAAFPLHAQVGSADLQAIRRLIAERKFEEALQKHLWFHEESKTSPGMGGVRLSFALAQWLDLGREYPPALDALKSVRDENAAKLLDGGGDFREFHDFSAINRVLQESERTYRLFVVLDANHPEVAKRCFDVALDLIVAHENYALFAKYGGDPIERYERIRQLREGGLKMAAQNPKLDNEQYRQFRDKAFEDKTVQLIRILRALERLDEAREIQRRALAYFPSPRIEESLPAAR